MNIQYTYCIDVFFGRYTVLIFAYKTWYTSERSIGTWCIFKAFRWYNKPVPTQSCIYFVHHITHVQRSDMSIHLYGCILTTSILIRPPKNRKTYTTTNSLHIQPLSIHHFGSYVFFLSGKWMPWIFQCLKFFWEA